MARDFESSNNDFIEVGAVPALDLTGDEITISVWVRRESTGAEQKVVAKWSDAAGAFQYLLTINSSGLPQAVVNTGGNAIATGTTSLTTGVWFHLGHVYDGTNVRIFVNGVEEDSTADTGNMSNTTAPVRIGAGSGGAGTENPFDGDIGHCAIWDVGLSAGEIESLANGVNPRRIRRGLFYAPLNGQDPELDIFGGLSLTVNGPTVVEEPPIPHSIVAPG